MYDKAEQFDALVKGLAFPELNNKSPQELEAIGKVLFLICGSAIISSLAPKPSVGEPSLN